MSFSTSWPMKLLVSYLAFFGGAPARSISDDSTEKPYGSPVIASSFSLSFGLPLAAAAPVVVSDTPRATFEEYTLDSEGAVSTSLSIEPFSDSLARLNRQTFLSADRKFPEYLTPAARKDAFHGNCEVWSSLLVLLKDEDFVKLIGDFNKPSPKQLGFIYFLGNIAGPRQYKLDPRMDFTRPSKRPITVKTRQGKKLSAKTPKGLGEKMLAEFSLSEKTIFLGTVPGLRTYVNRLPPGVYVVHIEYVGLAIHGGHSASLSISDSREYAVFNTEDTGVSFEHFLKWLNDKAPNSLISMVSYSPELSSQPIEMQRDPTEFELLYTFYRKDYASCKEMVASLPSLREHPHELFRTAIFYKDDLESVRFLHEELGIDLNVPESFNIRPVMLTVPALPTVVEEIFGGVLPIQYMLIRLFHYPEKTPILDYILAQKANINIEFESSAGIKHTPLSMAIRTVQTEVAIKLIAMGADLSRDKGVDLIQRCLEVDNHEILKALIRAGIDLKQPINGYYYNPALPKKMIAPLQFFTEIAEEYELSNPGFAAKYEALTDLAHKTQRKRTHPKAQTPIRQAMDSQKEEKTKTLSQ